MTCFLPDFRGPGFALNSLMSNEDSVASVYVLTPLTRDAGKSRRVIVQGIDLPWRTVVITGSALIASILPMAFIWLFIGQAALLVIPTTIGAAFYLIERRTRSGLRLRTYQAALDKRRAVVNLFLCCGVPVDPSQNSVRLLKSSSAPAVRLDDIDSIDIALTGSVLSARTSRHEPVVAPFRPPKRPRKAVPEGMFAPSGHESFWSDRGAPEISDAAPFDVDAALVTTGSAKPRLSFKKSQPAAAHSNTDHSNTAGPESRRDRRQDHSST